MGPELALVLLIVAVAFTIGSFRGGVKARFFCDIMWMLASFAHVVLYFSAGRTGWTILWSVFLAFYTLATINSFSKAFPEHQNEDSSNS